MNHRLRLTALLAAAALLAAGCTGARREVAGGATVAAGGAETTTPDAVTGDTAPAEVDPAVGPVEATAGGPAAAGAAGRGGRSGGGSSGATSGAAGAVDAGDAAVPVDAPGDPKLFAGALNTRGITSSEIRVCGHAALIFGPAFNATTEDFNVYYDAINDAGGVHGRKIRGSYYDDRYDPVAAVEAAESCKTTNPFLILGGIGFDQIPSVRNWAEANKELYFHHIATVRGSEGKQYSFTTQPTVERVGEAFAELAAARFKDQKIGILYRDSEFWQPGFNAFKKVAAEKGLNIVRAIGVQKNTPTYQQPLIELKNAGATVVWGWENTIALTAMVQQAKAQDYSPQWLAFPFNLTSQTLDQDALTPPMVGLSSWPGFSKGDYGGTFASYANDMKEFEAHYRKYRPNTDVSGTAGDLLWLNWVEQKRFVESLRACGRDCTRNHFAGLFVNGYRAHTPPTCPLDFSGGKRDGSGGFVNVLETYRSRVDNKVNWKTVSLCNLNDF
jgi:ABC-type branched-subunit amino acid transport system substrate-binding protein